ncbi:TetR/AcrR family transcriptional regulator [Nonomuraea basaltis]|uniref:TetR/AcrR family transcriptional regulator n=1 Tax=Nonomuraea basaltis TaxID=2495887 RepID=UPI00110C6BFA|nr:TetR/AcrR family transcriptional regulator [Nonomuraea basaltis]TMR89279.1 TetR/AcrR family transcriptional regulator [Nonomuraea basaltis]
MDSKELGRSESRPGARAKSQATRARILDAAQEQFNELGTAAVSTNHIAAAAGLSPGNLYYHFADKKEIIRALFARYAAAHEDRLRADADGRVNLVTLCRNLTEGAALAWRYRFFEREILALLRADAQLRADYQGVYERRLGQWLAFAEQLVAQGLLRPPRPPGTLRQLTIALWLIAENWLVFLDVVGDPQDPGQVAEGMDLVVVALEPYLTARGRHHWQAVPPGQEAGAGIPAGDAETASAAPGILNRERSSGDEPQSS